MTITQTSRQRPLRALSLCCGMAPPCSASGHQTPSLPPHPPAGPPRDPCRPRGAQGGEDRASHRQTAGRGRRPHRARRRLRCRSRDRRCPNIRQVGGRGQGKASGACPRIKAYDGSGGGCGKCQWHWQCPSWWQGARCALRRSRGASGATAVLLHGHRSCCGRRPRGARQEEVQAQRRRRRQQWRQRPRQQQRAAQSKER